MLINNGFEGPRCPAGGRQILNDVAAPCAHRKDGVVIFTNPFKYCPGPGSTGHHRTCWSADMTPIGTLETHNVELPGGCGEEIGPTTIDSGGPPIFVHLPFPSCRYTPSRNGLSPKSCELATTQWEPPPPTLVQLKGLPLYSQILAKDI